MAPLCVIVLPVVLGLASRTTRVTWLRCTTGGHGFVRKGHPVADDDQHPDVELLLYKTRSPLNHYRRRIPKPSRAERVVPCRAVGAPDGHRSATSRMESGRFVIQHPANSETWPMSKGSIFPSGRGGMEPSAILAIASPPRPRCRTNERSTGTFD